MEVNSIYPGSCGEIIQGKIDGRDMLLSCPVNIFTNVSLFECKEPSSRFNYSKSSIFLNNMLKRWGHEHTDKNLDIIIASKIPEGKGFASSTADLTALYICLLKMFKREYSTEELIEETIKIEPTDSIIFGKMTLFDYKEGKLHKTLGEYTKFYILAFEGNRIVDTVTFNNSALPPLADLDDIMPWCMDAIKVEDLDSIARASSISINRNLIRLDYKVHEVVLKICKDTGGKGIIGGHSGDVLGIIYDDKERMSHYEKKIKITGYKKHILETLRRNEYEGDYDCCSKQRQR
ncbi:MAG: kinase [Solirubrobacterales bacterium]